MLVSEKPRRPNANPPMQTNNAQCEPIMPNARPNASQWNIVRIGYARVGFALGMTFHVVCFLFPRVGYPTRTHFLVEYGLNAYYICREGGVLDFRKGEIRVTVLKT